MGKEIRVRPAVKTDCKQILRLIQELADYEHFPDGVKIDATVLERDGFEQSPALFKALVAECESEVVGYALTHVAYSTWEGRAMHMEDIYVTPNFRRHGVGTELFKAVAQMAVSDGCCRLNFSVLAWNKSAIAFYQKVGRAVNLTEKEEWNAFRLDAKAIHALANYNK